jgi:hypothetical protein
MPKIIGHLKFLECRVMRLFGHRKMIVSFYSFKEIPYLDLVYTPDFTCIPSIFLFHFKRRLTSLASMLNQKTRYFLAAQRRW